MLFEIRPQVSLKNENEMDEQEWQRELGDLKKFLIMAVKYYLQALTLSDKYNDQAVFRAFSLWFSTTLQQQTATSGISVSWGIDEYFAYDPFGVALFTLSHIATSIVLISWRASDLISSSSSSIKSPLACQALARSSRPTYAP